MSLRVEGIKPKKEKIKDKDKVKDKVKTDKGKEKSDKPGGKRRDKFKVTKKAIARKTMHVVNIGGKKKDKDDGSRIFGISEITEEAFFFLETCCSYVEHNGLDREGIYRVNGSATAVEEMKDWFDSDPFGVVIEDSNVLFDVCSLLKLFFRMMAIPLMTFEYYDAFIACAASLEIEDYTVELLNKLVMMLPEKNKRMLFRLLKHLQMISDLSQSNKMSCENLAIVFAPSLLFSTSDDPAVIIGDAKWANLLITKMIQNPEVFFFPPEQERVETRSPPPIVRTNSKKSLPLPPQQNSNNTSPKNMRGLPHPPEQKNEVKLNGSGRTLPPRPSMLGTSNESNIVVNNETTRKELPSTPTKTYAPSNPFANSVNGGATTELEDALARLKNKYSEHQESVKSNVSNHRSQKFDNKVAELREKLRSGDAMVEELEFLDI